MSAASAEHAADEAAGEEIFTSDGREPPIVTSPPPIPQQSTPTDDALLETTGLSAQQAFEVFAGKVYPMRGVGAAVKSGAPETPWQRLARLQMEAQELEADLKGAEAATTEPTLLQAVRDLQGRLADSTITTTSSAAAWHEKLAQLLAVLWTRH